MPTIGDDRPIQLKHKKYDTPFSMLMQDPQNQLEAYLALHPEARNKVSVEDIRDTTIRQIFADGPYNDLSFLVGDRQIVMVEAQSTWSENVVFRLVLYCAQIYQNMIEQQGLDVYKTGSLPLPAPEFVIIFTGERANIPEQLTLSDTVFKGMASSLEARAKVIATEGSGDILAQYIGFCKVLKAQIAQHGHTPTAIDETVRICQEKNYLHDFIDAHKHEVKTMLSTLFDQDKVWERYTNRIGQEKYDLGRVNGIVEVAKNFLNAGYSKEEVAKNTGLPMIDVERLATGVPL